MAKRIFDNQLPKHPILKKAALEYILSGKPYLGSDFVKAIAVKLAITPQQLALRLPRKRQSVFESYVDQVKAEFTKNGIHTGPDGGKHRGKNEKYYVSALGLAIARLATEMDAAEVDRLLSESPKLQPTIRNSLMAESGSF